MQFLNAQTGSDSTNNFFQIVVQKDAYYDSLINIRGVDSMAGTGYTGYLRWKAFMTPRVDDSGTIASYANVIKDYYDVPARGASSSETYNWSYFAPVGVAQGANINTHTRNLAGFGKGWVNRIFYDDASHTLYAGTHNNGIWKTTDDGSNWMCITLNNSKINGIVGLLTINNTLYALTYNNLGGYYNGLFKTTNDGVSWEYVPVNISGIDFFRTGMKRVKKPIRMIEKMNPDNTFVLYILTNNFVLSSTNGGNSWNTLLEISSDINDPVFFDLNKNEGFEDIIYDKANPNHLFVSGTKIYESVDAGVNWQDITVDVTGSDKVITCKMDNNIENPNNFWFFYTYSDDEAKRYAQIKRMHPDNNGVFIFDNVGDEQAQDPVKSFMRGKINITVDPNNINNIYVGGVQLYKATSSGIFNMITSRFYTNANGIHDDIRDMWIYTGGGNDFSLLTGCDGGVSKVYYLSGLNEWRTDDWSIKGNNRATDLDITEVYALDVKGKDNTCFFNCQDVGGYYKNDHSFDYMSVGDGGTVVFDQVYNYVYLSDNQFGGLSGYNLDNYDFLGFTCGSSPDAYFFPAIVQTPGNPKVTYFGLSNLRRFNNIYEYINTGSYETVPIVETLLNDDPITDVAISSLNPDIMYVSTKKVYWWDGNPPDASTYTGGLFKSTDGGQTWSDISAGQKGMFSGFITDIELNPNNDDELWLTYGYATYTSDQDYTRKIYRYFKDNNNNWATEPYSYNLPDKLPVNQMVIDKFTGEKYIATDVGVFKWTGASGNEWQNISLDNNNNYINKMATDIKINYQTREMFVSTFGAGIWESDLNDCPQYTGNITYINDQEDWYGIKQVNGDVVVTNGGNLTIHGTVYFNKNSKVIVEQGGKLTLDGAKLTNNCSGDYWQGIQVWGNKYAYQTPLTQGWLVMKNYTVIENAVTAIYLGKPDMVEHASGYGGGILDAVNSVFRNNITAVYVQPYIHNSISGLSRCDFITDNDYAHNTPPQDFINVNEYPYFSIAGCNFINRNTNGNKNTGNGITAFNSTLMVSKSLLNGKPVLNTFSGLHRGIDYYLSNSYKIIRVEDSKFENNTTGIYLSGASNVRITSNTFNIPAITDHCGLYLDNCPSGYTVEENKFIGATLPDENSSSNYGLVVNNSGSEEKMIYNNYFESLYYAAQAQYVNRNTGNKVTGLVYKCNDFRTNIYDITVLDPKKYAYDTEGIKFNQGNNPPPGEVPDLYGANNTFTWKGMLSDSLWLPDSSYTATLTAIADYGTGMPAVYARNMLLRMGAYSYNEPYLTVDTTQLKAGNNKGNGSSMATLFQNSCHLLLFPNPAGNYFTADYKVSESTTAVYLKISDINGKVLETVSLYQTEDQKIIETRQLSSGIYTVSLFADGVKAKSRKLVVIK